MIKRVSESHMEAYRTLIFATVCTFVVQIVFTILDGTTIGLIMAWLNSGHILLALAIGIWLYLRRNSVPPVKDLEIAFFVLSAPYIVTIWVGETLGLQLGQIRQPFVPFQFLCIYVAVLSPGRVWIAACEIFVGLIFAVAFWFFLKSQFPLTGVTGEPWSTLIYGFIALTMLAARAYRKRLIQKLRQKQLSVYAGHSQSFRGSLKF